DTNARDSNGNTSLHLAARFNKTPAVTTMLLDAGADPAARNAEGETPLDFAARNEALENTGAYRRLHDAGF
ncbi:MAG: ankyrin repeat domain-containing protein, partial [Gemmatimonadetes bacterium]|nr:ankyrin repeat domain-containing protein [Gemmatimonadota bacterium]